MDGGAGEGVTHRRVWRLAGPIILSNMTVPLLGAAKAVYVELRKSNLETGGPVDDHAKDSGPGAPPP